MDNENMYIILNYNHHLKFFKLYSTCLIWLLKMHLKNSSCTNHTDDLKISIWHTHLLHCALSQKIKVWWKKWILKDYRSIALFIWRNLNHDMEAVAHIPLQRKWNAFNKSICTSLATFYRVHYSPVDFIEWTTV